VNTKFRLGGALGRESDRRSRERGAVDFERRATMITRVMAPSRDDVQRERDRRRLQAELSKVRVGVARGCDLAHAASKHRMAVLRHELEEYYAGKGLDPRPALIARLSAGSSAPASPVAVGPAKGPMMVARALDLRDAAIEAAKVADLDLEAMSTAELNATIERLSKLVKAGVLKDVLLRHAEDEKRRRAYSRPIM
jgi:hypothetical protein